ncbi:phage tail tape measure protein [Paenibacillus caseinilyticus]|uniref:phage tail tape measure protein n=1 Tax=Paenibacillus caseinilyticus TaxID=3098138 RepID=UPI0022B8EF82|nr:phage tail tape measure protein [Paenibacillus caseinilyticus]MCZ8518887.1 phage tail tape measure protein [Paenibacillus caseinilyticus]
MGVIGNLMFAIGFKLQSKAVQKAQKDLGGLIDNAGKADNAIAGLGASLTALAAGGGAAVAALSLAAVGASAVQAAEEYERAMERIQGATGATGAQMQETRGVAESLYSQNFGENWSDLGSAISVTAQITKQQGKELENTTRNALLMRDAFGFEVRDAVRSADGVMENFGVTSDQAFNLLAQGAQKGLDANGNLLDTANEYSVFFDSLGMSANQMFDIFSAGAEAGAWDLDKVGDAVKEFNIRSKDGSKDSIMAYKMLGLNANEMMQTFARGGPEAQKSFTQIMRMISDIEDPVQRNTVGVALMGTQFEDLEVGVVAAMGTAQSQFDMTKDTMEELNQIKLNSLSDATMSFGRQIETGILIPIGQMLIPAVMLLSDALGFVIDNFEIIGPGLAGFALVIGVAVAPALWGLAVAGWAAAAPFLPFIGLAFAVGAAVAGVAWAFQNWGAITEWLGEVWSGFGPKIASVWGNVESFLRNINLFSIGADILEGLIKGIVSKGPALWGAVTDLAASIKENVMEALDIHSPSRDMMEIGVNTGEGFALGISGTADQVIEASDELAGSAIEGPIEHELRPASLPRAAYPEPVASGRQGGTSRVDVHVKFELTGNAVNTPAGQSILDQIDQRLLDVIESAVRRLGLQGEVVSYGDT